MGKKLLIAEYREVIRAGLRTIFENDTRIADIYETESFEGLLKYLAHPLDIIVVHQSLVSNINALPTDKFVLLVDKPDVEMLMTAYKKKARGYLSESVSADLLLAAVNIKSDAFLLDPTLFPWLINHMLNEHKDNQEFESLSPREREVLSLLKKGISRSDVAEQLHIAESTLKTHIKNINRKKEDHGWLRDMLLEQRRAR